MDVCMYEINTISIYTRLKYKKKNIITTNTFKMTNQLTENASH